MNQSSSTEKQKKNVFYNCKPSQNEVVCLRVNIQGNCARKPRQPICASMTSFDEHAQYQHPMARSPTIVWVCQDRVNMAALRNRFRGALLGALVGDCMGAYWETGSWKGVHPIEDVRERIKEQLRQTQSKKAPVITYTDDTALTFALADSLIQCGKFDAEHLAKRY